MSIARMTASALAIAAVSATAAAARDNVQIAGSSTVLPYASIVAEVFGETRQHGFEHTHVDWSRRVVIEIDAQLGGRAHPMAPMPKKTFFLSRR